MRPLKSKWFMLLIMVSCLFFGVYLVSKTNPTLSADDKTFYLSSAQYALEVTSAAHKLNETIAEEQVISIQEAVQKHIENIEKQVAALDELFKSKHIQ